MNYKFECDSWGSSFTVPSSVVNDYIKISDGNFIKVLLCVLSGNRCVSSEILSKKSGLSVDIVDDAINHWCSLGVLEIESSNKINVQSEVKELPKPVSVVESIKPTSVPTREKMVVVNYTLREIHEKAEKDENLKHLINDIQSTLQMSINGKELGKLVELYELYHFDAPTIMLVADYCASIGKRSIAYLSTVMIRWYEEGIQSYSDTEKKIIQCTEFKKFENKILRIFGMDSKPSKQQVELIDKWKKMGYSPELIEIAYNKCMDNKSKLNFKYIDGIITNWSEKAILTLEQVQINDAKYKSKKSDEKASYEKKNTYNLDKFQEYALNFSLYGADDEGTEN